MENNLNILGSKIKSETNKYKQRLLEEDYDYINFLHNQKSVISREFYLIVEEA